MTEKHVVVSFPARNEEKDLPTVLDSISEQSLRPIKVVIANDGSTDATKEIALSYDFVEVHDREKREGTVVGKKIMAEVWNSSITPVEKIHEEHRVDYLLLLGGDLVLGKDYIKDLVEEFEKDENLMMAAGKMEGDFAYGSSGFMTPGGGRMLRYTYWLEIGGKYPFNVGWEAYPIYRANMEGYTTKIFEDIPYYPVRPTGGRTDYYAYGQAMKALGYSKIFGMGRVFRQIFLPSKGFKAAWNMFRGFVFGKADPYEKEIRDFVKSTQVKRLKRILNPFR